MRTVIVPLVMSIEEVERVRSGVSGPASSSSSPTGRSSARLGTAGRSASTPRV